MIKPYKNKTFAGEPRLDDLMNELKEHIEDCEPGPSTNKPDWNDIQNKPDFENMAGISTLTDKDIQQIWDNVEVK